MDPMDHQDISAHLVTTAMVNGENITIERAPINPVVYLEPPTIWLSGPLGLMAIFLITDYRIWDITQLYFLGIKSEISHIKTTQTLLVS
jgi:hypothetical protein